jgi:hypothetical protein
MRKVPLEGVGCGIACWGLVTSCGSGPVELRTQGVEIKVQNSGCGA